jgi:hypothetical protein
MFRSRHGVCRRFAAWTAAIAFALNGLAPLTAQARSDSPPGLHDICTAGGVKQGSGDPSQRSLHCALCAVRVDMAAVAPDFRATLLVVSDFRHEVPAATPELFPEFRSNPPAPPRGPPLTS